jgi:hypothetical protein
MDLSEMRSIKLKQKQPSCNAGILAAEYTQKLKVVEPQSNFTVLGCY